MTTEVTARVKYFVFSILLIGILFSSSAFGDLRPTRDEYTWHNGHFRVPLTIKDNSGVNRVDWPVTTGVPLPYGLCLDTTQLCLEDSEGHEMPCQFEVLSRYWARDRSIRWVLLDFQISLKSNSKQVVYLTNQPQVADISNPIEIRDKKDRIEVSTGELLAVIPKIGGKVFDLVKIGGETVIAAGSDNGPFILSGEIHQMEHFQGNSWNTHGWNAKKSLVKTDITEALYCGAQDKNGAAKIEQAGAMRAVVLIKGKHMPALKGDGILSEGLYNYTIRLHFYRGKSYIKVEYAIENSDKKQPLYNHLFRQAGLQHHLQMNNLPVVTANGGGAAKGSKPAGIVALDGDQTIWLYQYRGKNSQKYGKNITVPGGYVVGTTSAHSLAPEHIVSGLKGRYVDVSDGKKGLSVSLRYLWEEAPRAIQVSADRIRIDVHAGKPSIKGEDFPRRPYDLDFGERSINDLLYYFHKGTARDAHVEKVAGAFEYPLFAHAPSAWYADTEAWYFEISPDVGEPDRNAKTDGHWIPEQSGYRQHGYMHGYNSGGHHESLNSGWLSFLRSGKLADLERNRVLSKWSISHNAGWCYKDNRLQLGEGDARYKVLDDTLEDWDRLTGFGPKDFYLWRSDKSYIVETKKGKEKRYHGAETYFNKYKWLPDIEHYAFFRLFEYYYLTGDKRALDAIHGMVNWAVNYQHKHMFKRKMPPLEKTDLFTEDPEALIRDITAESTLGCCIQPLRVTMLRIAGYSRNMLCGKFDACYHSSGTDTGSSPVGPKPLPTSLIY